MVVDIVGSSGVDGTNFTAKLWATERSQSLNLDCAISNS